MGRVLGCAKMLDEMRGGLRGRSSALSDAGAEPTLGLVVVGDDPHDAEVAEAICSALRPVGVGVREERTAGGDPMLRTMAALMRLDSDRSVHAIAVLDGGSLWEGESWRYASSTRLVKGRPELSGLPEALGRIVERHNVRTQDRVVLVTGGDQLALLEVTAEVIRRGGIAIACGSDTSRMVELARSASVVVTVGEAPHVVPFGSVGRYTTLIPFGDDDASPQTTEGAGRSVPPRDVRAAAMLCLAGRVMSLAEAAPRRA